jgi:hypothetical protein
MAFAGRSLRAESGRGSRTGILLVTETQIIHAFVAKLKRLQPYIPGNCSTVA